MIPVVNYQGIYPLSKAQHKEFSTLDTFDMFSPAHDRPQTAAALAQWFRDAGLNDAQILRTGHLVGRAVKPSPTGNFQDATPQPKDWSHEDKTPY
jgi:hypothetical protein